MADDGKLRWVSDICKACCRFLHENAIEEARARLRDGDAAVRANAAGQLGHLHHRGTVPDLCDVLAREGWHTPVTWKIVEALAAIGGPEAESALIAGLHNGPMWRWSDRGDGIDDCSAEHLLHTLAGMTGGSALAVRALCDTMTSTNLEPSVRVEAARYLSNIAYRFAFGDRRVTPMGGGHLDDAGLELMVEPLQAALRDPVVRGHATSALGHIGTRRALLDLIDMLGDEDDHVRFSAEQVLRNLGDSRADQALRRAIRNDPQINLAVMEALAKLR
jgi:HEAT repeat protein